MVGVGVRASLPPVNDRVGVGGRVVCGWGWISGFSPTCECGEELAAGSARIYWTPARPPDMFEPVTRSLFK